ncbi:hypothetical protein HZB03_03875 [Candidatus Woesearchaeota archaeon]|nr:hypothetical protein [Candidatus Woesearchaeota archaeon]
MNLGITGVIGRFKPLHNGSALLLENVCASADSVLIGIGSSNKYNLRNPFTAEESEAMIRSVLSPRFSNYTIIHVPDFAHILEYRDGHAWKDCVAKHFGARDHFVTGNRYVAELLKDTYAIVHPASLIPKETQFFLRATTVRMAMATGRDWQALVPPPVARYLESRNLVEHFRHEFGLETIATHAGTDYGRQDDLAAERGHTYSK